MALIKKSETNTLKRYLNSSETVVQTVTVTNALLKNKIEVTVGDITTVVEDWELPFSTLSTIPKYNSNTLVGIKLSPTGELKLTNESLATYVGRFTNSRAASVVTESDTNIQILVKNTTGSFAESDIIVFARPENYTLESGSTPVVDNGTTIIELLDTITITKDTSYSNADYTKYNISTNSYVDEIVVNQSVGIIDKSSVVLSAGVGSVRVLKSSLDNEPARFKVGFVNYPGIIKYTDN